MRWALYIIQLIFSFAFLIVTYAIVRWQASDFMELANWRKYTIFTKEGAATVSRLDELVYVAKHYPITIIMMILGLLYSILLLFLVYRHWKGKTMVIFKKRNVLRIALAFSIFALLLTAIFINDPDLIKVGVYHSNDSFIYFGLICLRR